MDETLDLDYSCSSDEIVTKSPECEAKHLQVNKEILKAQQMLDNLKLNYLKVNQKYKVVHKSNTHIIRENHNLKKRIEELEKKLKGNQNFVKPHMPLKETVKTNEESLSLSTILNSSSLLETASTQRCYCCNSAGSPSTSKGLCSFYQIRCKLGSKRNRPPSWFVEKPKKRFFTDIVLSQLPLFKF